MRTPAPASEPPQKEWDGGDADLEARRPRPAPLSLSVAPVLVPPEGGWGWIVVTGVAVTYMTNLALFSVFGLLFGGTLESWGLETTGVAVISSSMNAVQSFSGLFSGSLLKRFGPKRVSLAGGLLVAGGMVLSSVASQPYHIFITWSVLYGLLQPSTFLTVTSYFKSRRAQAVGIALAGTGLGQIGMPHLVRFLLEEYSFSGAVLILGAVALHSMPGCLLYRPPRRTPKIPEPDETQPLKGDIKDTPKILPNGTRKLQEELQRDGGCLSWCRGTVRSLDLDLLWDPRFLCLTAGTGLIFTSQTSFSMIFPFFLLESVGMSVGSVATCMSVQSCADVLSRLVLPLFTDRLRCRARNVMIFGALMAAASRSGMALLTGFPELVAMSAVTGFFRGATVLNQNLVIAEHVAPSKLPTALGMAMTVKGLCVLALGSLLGMVRDATGSFPIFIHCLSALIGVTAVIWALEAACSGGGRDR